MTELDIINRWVEVLDGASWCLIGGTGFLGDPLHWNWNVTRRTLEYAMQGYIVKTRGIAS